MKKQIRKQQPKAAINVKNQWVWKILIALEFLALAIFLIVPMFLVSHYVGTLAPEGLEWIGVFFAAGLSLSVLVLSGLSFVMANPRWQMGLILLALAEGGISLATYWLKGEGDLIHVIGLIGVVAIQEITILIIGSGLFATFNRVRSLPNEQRTNTRHSANKTNEPNEPPEPKRTGEKAERIIAAARANPRTTVTGLASSLGMSKSYVSETLRAHKVTLKDKTE